MINRDTHVGASFTLQNRLARVVWQLAYLTLFRFSPRPFHGWRRGILRLFGASVGRGAHIYPGVKIWAPWNLRLAAACGVADGVRLYSQALISIGIKAVVSQGAHICAGTHDYRAPGFPLVSKPISIGDYVWVAAEAFVHPGVTIAEGAVIGARSVVVDDMPEWMVCSGFPCTPIKERMSASEREKVKSN